jgi:hypothetical protein
MEDVGIFYGHLAYFTAIWYILWSFDIFYGYIFGIFSPLLVCCTKKNLATLCATHLNSKAEIRNVNDHRNKSYE